MSAAYNLLIGPNTATQESLAAMWARLVFWVVAVGAVAHTVVASFAGLLRLYAAHRADAAWWSRGQRANERIASHPHPTAAASARAVAALNVALTAAAVKRRGMECSGGSMEVGAPVPGAGPPIFVSADPAASGTGAQRRPALRGGEEPTTRRRDTLVKSPTIGGGAAAARRHRPTSSVTPTSTAAGRGGADRTALRRFDPAPTITRGTGGGGGAASLGAGTAVAVAAGAAAQSGVLVSSFAAPSSGAVMYRRKDSSGGGLASTGGGGLGGRSPQAAVRIATSSSFAPEKTGGRGVSPPSARRRPSRSHFAPRQHLHRGSAAAFDASVLAPQHQQPANDASSDASDRRAGLSGRGRRQPRAQPRLLSVPSDGDANDDDAYASYSEDLGGPYDFRSDGSGSDASGASDDGATGTSGGAVPAQVERNGRRHRGSGGANASSKTAAPSGAGRGAESQDRDAATEHFRAAGGREAQRHVMVSVPPAAASTTSGETESLLHARRIEAAGRGAPASAGQVTSAFTLLVVWPAVQFCVGGIYCFMRGALLAFSIALVHHWLEAGLQPVEVAVYCSIILIYILLPAAGRVSNLYAY